MSYIGAIPTTAIFPFDQFSGTGSATTFTLSYPVASTTAIIVTVAGVVQNPNTYTASATTLTFASAPTSGTNNIGVLYLGLPALTNNAIANPLTVGTGVSLSSGTTFDGTSGKTISIGQAVATSSNVQFNSVGVGTPGSATAGEIRATNNITAYYSSDRKLKENIRDIPDALAKVSAIGGKLFDCTDEYVESHGGEDGYFVQKSDFGVIAQDVQEHFPVAVRTKQDGTLAVDYEKMCALAFAAITELRVEIEELKRGK